MKKAIGAEAILLVENVLDISISDWKYKSTVR
jgi:hypothetical protein